MMLALKSNFGSIHRFRFDGPLRLLQFRLLLSPLIERLECAGQAVGEDKR